MTAPVLITGASRGLGRALAIDVARRGVPVIAMARQTPLLRETLAALQQIEPQCTSVACDLSDPDAIEAACQAILTHTQALSAVIHNAGILGTIAPVGQVGAVAFNKVMQVNVGAVHALTEGLISAMGGPDWCRVSLISSGAAKTNIPSEAAYCASKAALEMWGRCAAEDLRDKKVSVISVSPGIIDTNMQAELRGTDPALFPWHERFVGFHTDKRLVTPDAAAARLIPLALHHPTDLSGTRIDLWSKSCDALLATLPD